ncbi:Brix domain containing protein [Giardia lamblia P15]|uniref:Ribosome production factor 2 homolog n=1 Tax=Giardia intestinalis (strain P15) TaxID=658858 RepID=E1F5B8_GIAIA|nr:Brix domain containing protein [Giardia lamblia P15]
MERAGSRRGSEDKPRVPTTARGKRIMKEREPKIVENNKNTIFLSGSTANKDCNDLLRDLLSMRAPMGVRRRFRDREANPFVDASELEFLSQRVDCSLFCTGTSSKKRPSNIVIGRMFDGQVLDMVELGIDLYLGLTDIHSPKPQFGTKPALIFEGDLWSNDTIFEGCKSIFMDFFRGPTVTAMAHASLRYCHVFYAVGSEDLQTRRVLMRTYYLCTSRELEEKENVKKLHQESCGGITIIPMGPNVDFTLRRTRILDRSEMAAAMRRQRTKKDPSKVPGVKNAEYDELGREFGTVYVDRQDLDKLGLRRFKGLRRGRSESGEEGDGEETSE